MSFKFFFKLFKKQLRPETTTFTHYSRLEILNLLAGSAFSSDVASEAYWSKMFTEDTTFGQGTKQDRGRGEILKIINAPDQKEAINAGMTHLAMLLHINQQNRLRIHYQWFALINGLVF